MEFSASFMLTEAVFILMLYPYMMVPPSFMITRTVSEFFSEYFEYLA